MLGCRTYLGPVLDRLSLDTSKTSRQAKTPLLELDFLLR